MNRCIANAAPPAIDLAAFREVTGGDPQLERDLLGDFRDSINEDDAGLRAALARGDTDALRRYAHRIQGACGVIGALELAAACAAIQSAVKAAPHDAACIDLSHFNHALARLYTRVEQLLAGAGVET